jgi:antitoxin (DNA-binding transcriptional repressor) of toxin-antitoxin stability system
MTLLAPVFLLLAALAQDPEAERLKKEVDRLKTDNEVLLRQIKELSEKMSKLEGPKATADLLREEQLKQAVRAAFQEAELKAMSGAKPSPVPAVTTPAAVPDIVRPGQPTPRAPIDTFVTAVASEIGLVVISAGKDDRVQVGDEFTVFRKGEYVARIKIDRSDRKWSAGKVTARNSEPRVGDEVSNYMYLRVASVPATPVPSRGSAEELRSIRKELDDVRAQVRILSDRVIPSWQNEGLALEDLSEPIRSQLKIAKGVMVRQVRDGSPAAKFGFKPYDAIPDLSEDQVLRAVKEGGKVTIYRQGNLETLQGDRSR